MIAGYKIESIIIAGIVCAHHLVFGPTVAFSVTPHCTILGAAAGQGLGISIAAIDDVNFDGKADFIIGNMTNSGGNGRIDVMSGADCSAIYYINGDAGSLLGAAVSRLADVTGDGISDIVAVAPGNPLLNIYAKVRAFSGSDGTALWTNTRTNAPYNTTYVTRFINDVGDLNNDGVTDVGYSVYSIGSPSGSGSVIVTGSTGAQIDTVSEGYYEGSYILGPVFGVKDYNADGKKDFIIRNSNGLGSDQFKFAQSGPQSLIFPYQTLCTQGYVGSACKTTGDAERGVAVLPDVDGDGNPDFATKNYVSTFGSSVRVWSGTFPYFPLVRTLPAQFDRDMFGAAVVSTPDFDVDGIGDIFVGAPSTSTTLAGYVRLFSGATGMPLTIIYSDVVGDAFGTTIDVIGDVTGDGTPDLLVGSQQFTSGGLTNRGRVQIYPGPRSACASGPNLALQNETVTDVRMHKASGTISAGSQVTTPPYGDYHVTGVAANVSLKAGSSINLAPGLIVDSGAVLSAEVVPGTCS